MLAQKSKHRTVKETVNGSTEHHTTHVQQDPPITKTLTANRFLLLAAGHTEHQKLQSKADTNRQFAHPAASNSVECPRPITDSGKSVERSQSSQKSADNPRSMAVQPRTVARSAGTSNVDVEMEDSPRNFPKLFCDSQVAANSIADCLTVDIARKTNHQEAVHPSTGRSPNQLEAVMDNHEQTLEISLGKKENDKRPKNIGLKMGCMLEKDKFSQESPKY